MFEIKYHRKSTENLFRAGFKYRVVSGVMWGFLWELRCEAMQKKNDFFLKIFFKNAPGINIHQIYLIVGM